MSNIFELKTDEDALCHIEYIQDTIDKMTTGNLSHHKKRISFSLEELKEWLKNKCKEM